MDGEALYLHCDVTRLDQCQAAVNSIVKNYSKIDVLFNNAGIAVRKNAVDLEPDEWDLALNVSLKGQYLLSKCVIPVMKNNGGGSIINSGSGWSFRGGENAVAYCAMKGGSLNMTRAMCLDHGKDNIRVNIVCPGDVDTPMLQSECEQLGGTYDKDYKEECAERPLNRLGTVEDVANSVVFFASDLSAWVTGANLIVDGGGIA
jgi:NAD(P)-dependent dehydrogenase (short-subunit alcohol dehydrogenase family)